MSTFDTTFHKLRITVDFEYKYLVNVSLFDSNNRVIKSEEEKWEEKNLVEKNSKHSYNFLIRQGLYTVRAEINAEVSDKIVKINSDMEYLIKNNILNNLDANIIRPPNQYSSALLTGDNFTTYGSTHEYYIEPAIEFSKTDTFQYSFYDKDFSNSSLFIFMRFPSVKRYNELRNQGSIPIYKNFEIVNEDGDILLQFGSQGTEKDENKGWLAFNAKLPYGIYYLIYRGIEQRQIPIYVFKNWHTQFFITLGEQPLFGSIRIFISNSRVFDPKEKINKYIDILLDKLQNRDYFIDRELMETVAIGKYESPMLGLICSYLYFKSSETKRDNLFNTIKQNMQHVILKDNEASADIRALNILAAEHFNNSDYEQSPVKGTTMFRVGFEAIQKASIKYANLIPKNSLNDFISESLFYDSPFNTFKPVSNYRNVNAPFYLSLEDDKFSERIQEFLEPQIFNSIISPNPEIELSNNWVRTSISDLLKTNKNLNINDIASQLSLSGNTVSRIFDDWNNELRNK